MPTSSEISAGDIVQLKSGGPLMTVTEADHVDSIGVTWFDDKKELKYGMFPSHALNVRNDRARQ